MVDAKKGVKLDELLKSGGTRKERVERLGKKGLAVQLGVVSDPRRVELIDSYKLYNSLYSSRSTQVKFQNARFKVPPIEVGIVEIYRHTRDPNYIYALLPYEKILPYTNAKVSEFENNLKKLLINDLKAINIVSKDEPYSDDRRIELFQLLFERYMVHKTQGRITPPPNWEGGNLFRLLDDILRYSFGFQIFEFFFYDDDVEDIFINGYEKPVFLKMQTYNNARSTVKANTVALNRFETMVLQLAQSQFNETSPMLDVQIEGFFNIRINMTYGDKGGRGFSVDGKTVTMRKAKEIPPSLAVLTAKYGSVNDEVAALLFEFFHRNVSALIFGETGSGKTTLLKSLLTTVPRSYRIVSLEDTVELPNLTDWKYHHVRLHAKSPLSKLKEDEFDMEKGAKNLLRMRPETVVLGEIRYKEAKTLFEIAQMGVATVYSTAHGKDPFAILNRLVHHMDVEPSSLTSIDTIILMRTLRPYGYKGILRRVTNIAYLQEEGFDAKRRKVTLSSGEEKADFELVSFVTYDFHYDPRTKTLSQRWDIDWDALRNSKILFELKQKSGMTEQSFFTELTEKYNLIKAMQNGIEDVPEKELFRTLKYLDTYYVLKNDGLEGKELWDKLVVEMKREYGIRIDWKWDWWVLNKLRDLEK